MKRFRLMVVALVAVASVGLATVDAATAVPGRPGAGSGTAVKLRSTSYGKVLVGPGGRSLYVLTADRRNVSHCNSVCRSFWPPLKTSGKPRAGRGVHATRLGRTSKHQVTYYGKPLYYYAGDSKSGQTSGEGVHSFGGYWYLLNARGQNVTSSGGSSYPY